MHQVKASLHTSLCLKEADKGSRLCMLNAVTIWPHTKKIRQSEILYDKNISKCHITGNWYLGICNG